VTAISTQFDLDPQLQLIVPADISVVSNSGVFPVTSVPEPATSELLLAGTLALGVLARWRSHAVTGR
jgi:hypothetical protein